MADHSEFLAMAREMIAADGRLVTFSKLSATPIDTNKPWKGAGAPTPIEPVDAIAVFLPVRSLTDLGFLQRDNELFKSSEEALMVAPPTSGELLEDYHVLDDGGRRFRIVVTRMLKPGPTALLYGMGIAR